MREEIVSYCQEAGLRSPVSNPDLEPVRPDLGSETPHTPDHPKRPREDLVPTPRDDQDNNREDGEFLSDEEEVNFQLPAPASQFFKYEDYLYLLSKTISALDLQTERDGDDQNPENRPKKKTPKG